MSLSFYSNDHRRVSLPHPLPFESVFLGVYAFEIQFLGELGMENSKIDSWFMAITSRKIWPSFTEFKCLSVLYSCLKILVF